MLVRFQKWEDKGQLEIHEEKLVYGVANDITKIQIETLTSYWDTFEEVQWTLLVREKIT